MRLRVFAIELSKEIDNKTFTLLLQYCDNNKKERISKISCKKQKDAILTGDILARYALNKVFKIPFNQITFTYNEYGKPAIKGLKNIHFSISHSGDYVICAAADFPIGIDIQEKRKMDYLAFAERFFSKKDRDILKNIENAQDIFFTFWTQKESYLKAMGIGLSDILAPNTNPAYYYMLNSFNGYTACLCLLTAPKIGHNTFAAKTP